MTDAQLDLEDAVAACRREIGIATLKLAAKVKSISGEQFAFDLWNPALRELLDDCLRDATLKLDSDAADGFAAEVERLADVRAHLSMVL